VSGLDLTQTEFAEFMHHARSDDTINLGGTVSEVQWRHINCAVDVLKDSMTPRDVIVWLADDNEKLGGRPVDLIADRRLDEVLVEAQRAVS
jgi:hypothetical protein